MTIDADVLIQQIRLSRVRSACVFAAVLAEQGKFQAAEYQYDLADKLAAEFGIAWEAEKHIDDPNKF